jgi:hypothetical protein
VLAGKTQVTVNLNNYFLTYPYLELSIFTTNYSQFILVPQQPNVDISQRSIQVLSNVATAIGGGSVNSIRSALTGLILSIPSLSSVPICPAIVDGSVTTADNGNTLQFAIGIPYPLTIDMPINYRVLTTSISLG